MRLRSPRLSTATAVATFLLSGVCLRAAGAAEPSAFERRGRELLRELIEIDTTEERGSTTVAAEAMARHLLAAGFPPADVQVLGPAGSKNYNLVVRLRGGSTRKPLLLLAHLDVVEARRADWSVDPFHLTEKEGFFYGRGTTDIKDGAAILVATLLRLKEEGFKPDRDIVLALTAGEEWGRGDTNGVEWLLKEHREQIDATFCLNVDGGDPQSKAGKRILRPVQASEKVFMSLRLEVTNPGGHSSLPVKENAIYRLAAGLGRIAAHDFPMRLNEVTRAYFAKMAPLQADAATAADMKAVVADLPSPAVVARLSAAPFNNAQMRTTCVATQIEGGHAENALPQRARATINCRLLPDEPPAAVEATIRRLLADDKIQVSVLTPARQSPASPLTPEVMGAVERITTKLWPGVTVVPVMETGATDGAMLRIAGIPTYGVSGVFIDIDDVRAHGRDERVAIKDYDDGLEYTYRLVRAFAGD